MSFNERYINIRRFLILNKKKVYFIVLILILIPVLIFVFNKSQKTQFTTSLNHIPSVKPTDTPFVMYKKPVMGKKKVVNLYLIGDSMTHAFGPRGGVFNEILNKAVPGVFFEISNYAEANQSVLLLPERLKVPVQADHDLLLVPILEGKPDIIIIESFGYNPLSQLGLEEGLKKQEEVLTEVMTTLTNKFPDTVIMFLVTIAPDKKTYGMNVTQSSADARWAQAEERIEYIANHINYANDHGISVVNAYEASLDTTGDGDTKYINPDDNIHPSAEGLSLMGRIMSERIIEEI